MNSHTHFYEDNENKQKIPSNVLYSSSFCKIFSQLNTHSLKLQDLTFSFRQFWWYRNIAHFFTLKAVLIFFFKNTCDLSKNKKRVSRFLDSNILLYIFFFLFQYSFISIRKFAEIFDFFMFWETVFYNFVLYFTLNNANDYSKPFET